LAEGGSKGLGPEYLDGFDIDKTPKQGEDGMLVLKFSLKGRRGS
jgi:hypothetical protein